MSALNLKIEGKIAILEFDQPDSKVNVLNTSTMRELSDIITRLKGMSGSEVKALIITSRKKGIFIAGADIKEIEHITSTDKAKEKAEKGKEILNELEALDLVTIAAINGACLGGGFELSLACKYRVASFSDKVKIGLPEVNLGIIPGFGGTQRLPKLVGLTGALGMIVPGRIISGKDALKYGVADRLFPEVRLVDASIEFAKGILDGSVKVKRKKKKKMVLSFLEDTPIGRSIVFSQAKKGVLKKTKGFYPAPIKAIEVVKRTYGGNIRKGSLIESEVFSELAITEISKNLIKVFYLNEEYKKLPWVDADIKPAAVKKCGVVGAGVMGGGIAQLTTFRDIPTRIKDINYEAINHALKTASSLFKYALKKRKLKKHDVDYKFGLISSTITYKGFENTDLVIEAVVENLDIKKKVFNELSQVVSSKTVLTSNTSSLPIINMAEATNMPERVVGLHFFNPVHRMPLIEVIRSSKSGEQALATVIAFARRLGKVVIVVKDVPGFLINRILLSYLNEAGFLMEEGIKIDRIDRIALKFGMPMGPIELMDEIGIDVGAKVADILEDSYGRRMEVASILKKVKDKKLYGKKTKRGFYIHKGKKVKVPNPDIYRLIEASGQRAVSDEALHKRLIYVMINEAARCLEEGVADRPQTIDIGMIMGTGFPPFRAGLLRYADSVGIGSIVKDLKDLEKELGHERFKPCDYLIDRAEKNRKFYD
jgi:3-hydroxyacyl-CoA dehydrogenase/enoyl-CoA hydratase/3-hydroxybutyryl-CoA epimerase